MRKKDYTSIQSKDINIHFQEGRVLDVGCGGNKKNKCPDYDVPPDGIPADATFGVRCCSETRFSLNAELKDGCDVWGGSKGGEGGFECNLEATLSEAEQWCAELGARLCTCTELADGCAKSTGCGLNRAMVWCT